MKEVIETLKQYYNSFISQEYNWPFFLGLADYVKFIKETPKLKELLGASYTKSYDARYRKLDFYEKKTISELKQVKKILLQEIKKQSISFDALLEALKDLRAYEKGQTDPSFCLSERLDTGIKKVIKALYQNNYKSLVKHFLPKKIKDDDLEIGFYKISKSLGLRRTQSGLLRKERETEVWGAWEKASFAYLVIFEGDMHLARLKQNKNKSYLATNFKESLEEMEAIKDGRDEDTLELKRKTRALGTKSRTLDIPIWGSRKIKEFKKTDYKLYATRIHNFLVKELNKQIIEAKPIEIFTNEVVPDRTEALLEQMQKEKRERTQWVARKLLRELESEDRIEKRIIEKIQSEGIIKNNKKTDIIDYQTSFDKDKSVLSICGKNIEIRKFSNQYHILRIIFQDDIAKDKDWQLSEIAELIDRAKDFEWKNLYNAADAIKKKIAIETGIKDFFITTTQSIKINEKYLKKS